MRLIEDVSNYIELKRLKRIKSRFERKNRITLDEVEFFDRFDIDKTGEEKLSPLNIGDTKTK